MAAVLGLAERVQRGGPRPRAPARLDPVVDREPVGAVEADPGDLGQRVGVLEHQLAGGRAVQGDHLADVAGQPVGGEQRVEAALGAALGPLVGGLGGAHRPDPAQRSEDALGVAVDHLEDLIAVLGDEILGPLAPDPRQRAQVAAGALGPGRVERLRLAGADLQAVAGVVLDRADQQRPLLLLEVGERADRRHRGPVGERHLGDGEGAVLADEAEELDLDLALERVAGRRAGVEQRLLILGSGEAHPNSEPLTPAGRACAGRRSG